MEQPDGSMGKYLQPENEVEVRVEESIVEPFTRIQNGEKLILEIENDDNNATGTENEPEEILELQNGLEAAKENRKEVASDPVPVPMAVDEPALNSDDDGKIDVRANAGYLQRSDEFLLEIDERANGDDQPVAEAAMVAMVDKFPTENILKDGTEIVEPVGETVVVKQNEDESIAMVQVEEKAVETISETGNLDQCEMEDNDANNNVENKTMEAYEVR